MRTKKQTVTNSGCHVFGKFSSVGELGKIQGIQLLHLFLKPCTHDCTRVCMHQQTPTSPKFMSPLPSSGEDITQQSNTLTLVPVDTKMYVWGKAEFGVLHPMPGKWILFAKAKAKSPWKASLCSRKGVCGQTKTLPIANLGPIKTPIIVNFLLQQSMSLEFRKEMCLCLLLKTHVLL